MTQYFIRNRGEVRGPFPPEKLKELARRGQFGRHYQVSESGEVWESAANHPELLPEAKAGKIRKQPQAEPVAEPTGYELAEEYTPGAGPDGGEDLRLAEATSSVTGQTWRYAHAGEEHGPLSFEELQQLASQGQLQFNDVVWTEGMATWIEAFSVNGLFPVGGFAEQSPQPGLGMYRPLDNSQDPTAAAGPIAPFAVASLVSGVIGVPMCLPSSIVAVVLGHMALRQIAAAQGELGGRGLALAGLILGYAAGAISILVLLATLIAKVIKLL
ncbi:MAG: GYF domain-containing protein [Planctomycetota bacterium]|nr:GYF domain-containing protein [Planctomycetota bacterium]